MNKLVYIIVPVYNVEKFLEKCLNSIFEQTYKNIKVICINDGSVDNSSSILKKYKAAHTNLVLINQNNKGVSSARNAALDILDYNEDAYLTFVDADDWVEKNYIENLVIMLERYTVDLVCSSFFLAKGDRIKLYKNIDEDIVLDNVNATNLLIKDETIQSHSVSCLFKLYLWKNVRYDLSLFYMEDQATIFELFYKSKNVFITNYSGYFYRQDNNSAVTKNGLSTKKVVSGLKGYYRVCMYDFSVFDKEQLLRSANNALGCAFLMLIPYYKKNDADDFDRKTIKEIKRYIRINRVVWNYKSNSKKNSIKKKMYLLCPSLYPLLFFVAKKIMK